MKKSFQMYHMRILAFFVISITTMRKFGLFLSLIFLSSWTLAQNPKFDKLEMLFEQGHYKSVYRKANRLLDNPVYDFSQLPSYYKSLALLELSQNKYWLRNHDKSLIEAEELFMSVKRSNDASKIFTAHKNELSWVRDDLISWASDLKRTGDDERFMRVQHLIDNLFEGIDLNETNQIVPIEPIDTSQVIVTNLTMRDAIVYDAKKQLGVPYVWAGSSPDGFDCSGFTSYVLNLHGKKLSRRAADQYNEARKVREKNVQKGDFVFFDNGSGISHVGIVISDPGEPLTMIHSSSSKGIIITNIEESEYWKKRVYGFGSYID